jgi:hypothetical protein
VIADQGVPYLAALRHRPTGLAERAEAEHLWDQQREESLRSTSRSWAARSRAVSGRDGAGQVVTIAAPAVLSPVQVVDGGLAVSVRPVRRSCRKRLCCTGKQGVGGGGNADGASFDVPVPAVVPTAGGFGSFAFLAGQQVGGGHALVSLGRTWRCPGTVLLAWSTAPTRNTGPGTMGTRWQRGSRDGLKASAP